MTTTEFAEQFELSEVLPCGIPIVNNRWYLWYPRQLFFLLSGIYLIITH